MNLRFWNSHVPEPELALYGTGDGTWRRTPGIWLHVSRCEHCRARTNEYGEDHEYLRHASGVMPTGVNWERMASEMSANIRVGLAAGECVTPRSARRSLPVSWRIAFASAGFATLMAGAWWLNAPAPRAQSLGKALRSFAVHGPWGENRGGMFRWDESRTVVHVSSQGIEVLEGGTSMGLSQGEAQPVAVSLSVKGSARANYIDADTGQVTITSVYAQ